MGNGIRNNLMLVHKHLGGDIQNLDIKDGELVEVKWLAKAWRWIKNLFPLGGVDKKICEVFHSILKTNADLSDADFPTVKCLKKKGIKLKEEQNEKFNKVCQLLLNQNANSSPQPDPEPKPEPKPLEPSEPKKHDQPEDPQPPEPLPPQPVVLKISLEGMKEKLEENNILKDAVFSLHSGKRGEPIEKFISVLVEFTKDFSIIDIATKGDEILKAQKAKFPSGVEGLKASIEAQIQAKIKANVDYLDQLHIDTQKQFDPTHARSLERGLNLLLALANKNTMISFEVLTVSVLEAWDYIKQYQKPEGDLDETFLKKIVRIANELPAHIETIDMNEIKLGTLPTFNENWNHITKHLGVEVPFVLDVPDSKAEILKSFIIEYVFDRLRVDITQKVDVIMNNVYESPHDYVLVIHRVCEECQGLTFEFEGQVIPVAQLNSDDLVRAYSEAHTNSTDEEI
jgi:hypothetical protein